MAIRLVKEDCMPKAETREAMIQLDGGGEPIQAHYHKHAETGEIHVCVQGNDEDDDDESAPASVAYDDLIGKPLRLVINDDQDSEYKGHFNDTGLFVPAIL